MNMTYRVLSLLLALTLLVVSSSTTRRKTHPSFVSLIFESKFRGYLGWVVLFSCVSTDSRDFMDYCSSLVLHSWHKEKIMNCFCSQKMYFLAWFYTNNSFYIKKKERVIFAVNMCITSHCW